uniref:Serine aminopeptidase S33 domain-containing protein n=1 Tax=Fabrea salina TaxID=342563 RepID=A0A7S3IA79_9CILI|mmetsp:Transcript_471/g.797  ORF Transcript_471/g.797 Transcript_471/m.797 type:complete len:288 (+) Transcript_471:54-917(+)
MELNSILFPAPSSSYDEDTFPGDMIWIPRAEKVSIPCLYLTCPRGSSKVLLYFHGNAEDVGLAYELMDHLRSTLMIHVLAIEYPGYGIYTGKPSAEAITQDADYVFKYLVEEVGVSPRDIFLFGRSIGSGPATWLAANRNPGVLLLMSAYTSIGAVVKNVAGSFARFLVKERFRNIDLMPQVTCPCFLVHGQQDSLIPYEDSQQLADKCSGPCSLILPKDMDHNEFDFFDDLSLPFSAFLLQCGISVFPESMHAAFLNIPANLFTAPPLGKNQNKGRVNSLFRMFSK